MLEACGGLEETISLCKLIIVAGVTNLHPDGLKANLIAARKLAISNVEQVENFFFSAECTMFGSQKDSLHVDRADFERLCILGRAGPDTLSRFRALNAKGVSCSKFDYLIERVKIAQDTVIITEFLRQRKDELFYEGIQVSSQKVQALLRAGGDFYTTMAICNKLETKMLTFNHLIHTVAWRR